MSEKLLQPNTQKEAIEQTLELHKYALEHNVTYRQAKALLTTASASCAPQYAHLGHCPLCAYISSQSNFTCYNCPWFIYTGNLCDPVENYSDSQKAISRLESWLEELKCQT